MEDSVHLKELLETWYKIPVLYSSATNGLDPRKDKLLGYTTRKGDKNDVVLDYTTGVDLLTSQRYHKLTDTDMQHALQHPDFCEALTKLVTNESTALFTYNTVFQSSFILETLPNLEHVKMYDLTVIEKAIRNKYSFEAEQLVTLDTFYEACNTAVSPVPITLVCKNLRMSKDPSPGQLPMERMVEVLQQLFSSVCDLEVQHL